MLVCWREVLVNKVNIRVKTTKNAQLPPAALMARPAEGAPPSTSLEVDGKQEEEEEVDLDSSLIWAIRYLECDAVEEMLSEGANI